jgi:hypothetical protein
MGHDARNGLAAIVARAQMLARRLRRGGPVEHEDVALAVAEIERIAKRTARRVEEIERPFHGRRAAQTDDPPIADPTPDHGDRGGP